MAQVTARPGEAFEALWKRFKRITERENVLADLRKHEFFEKPSVRKKRKSAAARKREAKKYETNKPRSGLNFRFNDDKTIKIYQRPQRGGTRQPQRRTRRD
jgi:small subunit ribosomal protein S21